MNIWHIVLISILASVAYLIIWIISLNHLSRIAYAKACGETYDFVFSEGSPIGLITYLIGKQGAGKTTMGAGLTNLTALYMQKLATDTIEKISGEFPKIPWKEIDDIILSEFQSGVSNWLEIMTDVKGLDDENLSVFLNKRMIETYLFPKKPNDILQTYIEAKLALLRNNYVYFKGSEMIVRFNYRWAMDLDNELLKLTDNFYKGNYHLLKYVAIFEDEKTISARNKNSNYAKSNGGSYLFSQFIRHLAGEGGKIRYFTTTQRAGRVNIFERELSMTTIKINGHRELFNFDFGALVIKAILPFLTTLQKSTTDLKERFWSSVTVFNYKKSELAIKNKRKHNWETLANKYLEKANRANDRSPKSMFLKALINRLNDYQKKAYSNGFLFYDTTIFTNIDSDGNYSGEGINKHFVFPLAWCYGSVNTYAYSWIDSILAKKAYEKSYNVNLVGLGEKPDFEKGPDEAEINDLFYRVQKKNKRSDSTD